MADPGIGSKVFQEFIRKIRFCCLKFFCAERDIAVGKSDASISIGLECDRGTGYGNTVDLLPERVTFFLLSRGAGKSPLHDDRFFTTLAFVTFDSSGDRSFSFARKPGADTQIAFDELDLSLIDDAKVFHFGTLSLTDEPARTATQKAVAYAKSKSKLITYDPNLRKPLWQDSAECKEQLLWGLSQADVVKISDEEVEFLFGCTPEEGADILLSRYGVKLAMVTLGPNGAYLKNETAACKVSCPQVRCVDTTGAGDIFGGSAVSRLLALGKDPAALTEEELRGVGSFAATAASLSTQAQGGIPSIPDISLVNQYLSGQTL